MGDDELDNLTERITGDKSGEDSDDGIDERLEEASILTGEDGEERTPEEVIDALGDDDPERSAQAADTLEQLADEKPGVLEEHEDELIEALEIDDSWARRASASALAEVGSMDAVGKLEGLDMPEANEASQRIRERHGDEPEEGEEESESTEATATTPSTTDGGTRADSSAASTGEGRALDAAKNGDAGVEFSEIVVLQMLESDKEEPNKYAEESLRYAVREYPEMAVDLTDRLADRLTEGRDDVRRYASIVMHEVSEEYVDEARDYIPQIVESLSDEDEEVSERGQETLTNIAEEYPDDVVGNVAEISKN